MLYHVTPAHNLESILIHGLQPAIGQRSAALGEQVYRIYLFTSLEACHEALSNWLGEAFEDEPDDLAILEVDGRDLPLVSEAGYEVASAVAIETQRIVRVLDEAGTPINHRGAQLPTLAMK